MSARTDALWAAAVVAANMEDEAWAAYEVACAARKLAFAAYYDARDLELHGAPLERVTMAQAEKESQS